MISDNLARKHPGFYLAHELIIMISSIHLETEKEI